MKIGFICLYRTTENCPAMGEVTGRLAKGSDSYFAARPSSGFHLWNPGLFLYLKADALKTVHIPTFPFPTANPRLFSNERS